MDRDRVIDEFVKAFALSLMFFGFWIGAGLWLAWWVTP
jgi:hypothetical protein